MDEIKNAKRFDPGKYGMAFCPGCSGSGRSYTDAQGNNVCEVCGGFGCIKKDDNNKFGDDSIMSDNASDLLW